ncbi:uncharacterized protein LOC135384441 [Ornithodoros turicata]|uniref:uncharacterized protein LOC135384441 n=1 Tax=Ornithodoros turicata TaxID=34597 RepID=UPI00313882AA
MPAYGNIEQFDGDTSAWTDYRERIQQYFESNNDAQDKQRTVFLTCCGKQIYTLLRSLLAPAAPSATALSAILEALDSHYSPKPSQVVARYKFSTRVRQEGEAPCLLEVPDLALVFAKKTVVVIEAARNDSKTLSTQSEGTAANFAKNNCGKKSHLAKVCQGKANKKKEQVKDKKKSDKKKPVYAVEDTSEDEEEATSVSQVFDLNKASNRSDPFRAHVVPDGVPLEMELDTDTLGTLKGVTAKLHIQDGARPRFFKARAVPFALQDRVAEELQRMQREGIIEPVKTSEWAAPIVPVVKRDGHVRICGDFKITVNPVAVPEKYPIPRVEELFAKLSGGNKFSKLDIKDAYQQILLDEESKNLVTINTQKGLYRYVRLPFGVSTAPALFLRIMENLLQDLRGVVVYFDDILVTGKDDDDHKKNLDIVLRRLEEAGLRLKHEKCIFMASRVHYLGHVITEAGLHPDPKKVEAVTKAPPPTNVKTLQSYLGLVNYYRKFLPDLSTVLHPLNKLLGANAPWTWGTEQRLAFQKSKDLLTSARVLAHFDPKKPLVLVCDASPYGVGAVLAYRELSGPLKGHYIFILVDAFSKCVEAEVVPSPSAEATISCLRSIFTREGLPDLVVSDNGPAFVSANYRTTPHEITGASPAELLCGRKLKTALYKYNLHPDMRTTVLPSIVLGIPCSQEIFDLDQLGSLLFSQRHKDNRQLLCSNLEGLFLPGTKIIYEGIHNDQNHHQTATLELNSRSCHRVYHQLIFNLIPWIIMGHVQTATTLQVIVR